MLLAVWLSLAKEMEKCCQALPLVIRGFYDAASCPAVCGAEFGVDYQRYSFWIEAPMSDSLFARCRLGLYGFLQF